MDGKHIALKAPYNILYVYIYKHFHSTVCLAVVDANYRLIMFDVGVNGKFSAGVEGKLLQIQNNLHDGIQHWRTSLLGMKGSQ